MLDSKLKNLKIMQWWSYLFVEDRLGLSSESGLFRVVSTLSLGKVTCLSSFVLRNLVDSIFSTFLWLAESTSSLGNVYHYETLSVDYFKNSINHKQQHTRKMASWDSIRSCNVYFFNFHSTHKHFFIFFQISPNCPGPSMRGSGDLFESPGLVSAVVPWWCARVLTSVCRHRYFY